MKSYNFFTLNDMELKEYLNIFKKYKKTFVVVVCVFLFIGLAIYFIQPLRFKTEIMLNVTRKASQQTDQYRYDDFYRLQADERFADTVVRWIGAASILRDVAKDSGAENEKISIKAGRLSSQMIQVSFYTQKSDSGIVIAKSLTKVLNAQTDLLNKDQRQETWFSIVSSDPITERAQLSFAILFLGSLFLGIFFGVWTVMFRHYFAK